MTAKHVVGYSQVPLNSLITFQALQLKLLFDPCSSDWVVKTRMLLQNAAKTHLWGEMLSSRAKKGNIFTAGGAGHVSPAACCVPLPPGGEWWTKCFLPSAEHRGKSDCPVLQAKRIIHFLNCTLFLNQTCCECSAVVSPWGWRSKKHTSSPACSRSRTPNTRQQWRYKPCQVLQVAVGESNIAVMDHPHLSCSCPDAPGSVHDSGDSGQCFLAPPQSFLSAQVCRDGGADHGGRTANEAASVGQENGVDHLVIGRA